MPRGVPVKKRCWTVFVPGWQPFQMVTLDGDVDRVGALEIVRGIWPGAEVE